MWAGILAKLQRPRTAWIVFIFCITLVVLALQAPHLHGPFLSDDSDWVRNARIRVTSDDWLDAFKTSTGGNFYRPLVAIGFQVDYALSGYNTLGYHLHQLCFHLLLVSSVAFLLWQIFQRRSLAFAVAALFAVYPSHHEVITWIAGRPDLYAATFVVLACGFFVQFLRRKRFWQYGLFLLFAACGFLSKEIAFALPALAFVCVLFMLPFRDWKAYAKAIAWISPLVILLAAVLLIRNNIISDAIGGYLASGERKGLDFKLQNISKPFMSILYWINWSYAAERFGHAGTWMRIHFLELMAYWAWPLALAVAAQLGIWLKWKNRAQMQLWLFGVLWSLMAFIPVFGLSNYVASNLTASRLFFMSSIGYACIFVAYVWPFANVTGWKRMWKAAYPALLLLAIASWMFNAIPWKSAYAQVNHIREALRTQRTELIPSGTDAVMVSNLPGLVHGAYMYFGVHSIKETVYEITRDEQLQTFLVGNRAYPDSPFCAPHTQKIVSIRWDSTRQQFTASRNLALAAYESPVAAQPLTWDFSNPATAKEWTPFRLDVAQEASGLRLTMQKTSGAYLASPALADEVLAKYGTMVITFSAEQVKGLHQTTVQWSVDGDIKNGGAISGTFGNEKEVTIIIPTCQYLHWSLAERVDGLRILPTNDGTVVLKTISLLP